jgi:hypothetical protein
MPNQPKSTDGAALAPGAPAAQKPGDQHLSEPSHPGVPLAPPGIVPESDVRVHTPAAAAPLPEHGHVNDGLGELPRGYGDGRLVPLVRDPHTLFVYWDFSLLQIEQTFADLGPARAALQLWQARNGGELVREQEVHLDSRSWYLRDLPAGVELRVELWALGEKGARMLRAARPIKLPPAAPSDVLEAFYLRLPLDQGLGGGLPAGHPLSYGGAAPAGWERRLQPRAFGGSSLGPGQGSGAGPGARMVPGPGDEGEK